MAGKGHSLGAILWSAIILAAFSYGPARAGDEVASGETREYRIVYLEKKSGDSIKINASIENVTHYTSRLSPAELDGQDVYLQERTEYTSEGDKHIWKIYVKRSNMGLLRLEKKTVSRSGKEVRYFWTDYQDPMFDYPDVLCHVYTITTAMRKMDLFVGAEHDINLLLDFDSLPWHMYLEVETEEKVEVPAGAIDCYKVVLKPDYKSIMGKWAWTSSIIKPFVPDFVFWMEKEKPRELVRFQGTFGPVGGSPPQSHELVSIIPPE